MKASAQATPEMPYCRTDISVHESLPLYTAVSGKAFWAQAAEHLRRANA
ncbi:hypothetical protein [Nocardia sp. NPDC049149]